MLQTFISIHVFRAQPVGVAMRRIWTGGPDARAVSYTHLDNFLTAENAVIGACLVDPALWRVVLDKLHRDDLYSDFNREAYDIARRFDLDLSLIHISCQSFRCVKRCYQLLRKWG